jgi:hypothetical protein
MQRRRKLNIGVSVLSCTEGANEQPAATKLLLKCFAEEKAEVVAARKKKQPPELSTAMRQKKTQRRHQMQQLEHWLASKRAVEQKGGRGGESRTGRVQGVSAAVSVCLRRVCAALKANGRLDLVQEFVASLQVFSLLCGVVDSANQPVQAAQQTQVQAQADLCARSRGLLKDQLEPALLEELLALFATGSWFR